jgi:hypothetical protein
MLAGDVVGLQSYYPAAADGKSVDLTKTHLAVRASRLGEIEADVEGLIGEGCADETALVKHELTSVGNFTAVDPDANAVCSVPTSSVGEIMTNEIMPSGDVMDDKNPCKDGYPPFNLKYEWRNVQVLVTADAPGTRFQADLTYTEDGCTATYKVCGVWPAVDCEKLDAKGERTGLPEQKLCDALPDPEPPYGLPAGSSINEDFGAVCDPELRLCVLPACPF